MEFEEALAYMEGLLRFGWKLGNGRMEALCERLGDPQTRYPILHIAGTKGKGSTTALSAGILRAAGMRVGAYFSPYVYDVCERVQVNGEPIPRADFARLVTQIRPHIEALAATEHGQVTEFELKTALGFLYFAEQQVDFACIEVGIGGRLDATNIVAPLVTVITNIGLDHTSILGETHALIAAEKAGIIKESVPCFTATENADALAVIARIAGERHAPLTRVLPQPATAPTDCAGEVHWHVGAGLPVLNGIDPVGDDAGAAHTAPVTVATPTRLYPDLALRMGGLYQRANAACAVAATEAAFGQMGRELPMEAVRKGLATTALPGRFTVVRMPDGPLVILDGAHNEMAARALAGPVAALQKAHHAPRLLLVIGMLTGHEPDGVLAALAPLAARVYCCQPTWKRAQIADEVAQAARHWAADVVTIPSVPDAARQALADARPNDIVLITGSFYTVGEVPIQQWAGLP